MKNAVIEATRSYLTGMVERHKLNALVLIEKRVGVAEHPDVVETICEELGKMAEYEDKLSMLDVVENDL